VVGEVAEFRDVGLVVGRGVGDDVFLEIIAGEPGFPKAGGAAAVEVVAEKGEGFPAGKPLSASTRWQPAASFTSRRIRVLRLRAAIEMTNMAGKD